MLLNTQFKKIKYYLLNKKNNKNESDNALFLFYKFL